MKIVTATAIVGVGMPTRRHPPDDPSRFCNAIDEWADLMIKQEGALPFEGEFEKDWRSVRTAIRKSCLLSRTIYGGEKPSKTPCPVHQGRWIGCHIGWPGQHWSDGNPVDVHSQQQEWFDAGCRCYMHSCGCTTGWQPDEHCGCGVKP